MNSLCQKRVIKCPQASKARRYCTQHCLWERCAEKILVLINRFNIWADSVWLCIFHFPLCTSQSIKAPFENKVMGLAHRSLVSLCCSFFPFPSFSLSVLLSGWLFGTQELYWLSVFVKEDQALLSTLLSLLPKPSSWGYTWILLGLDPGNIIILYHAQKFIQNGSKTWM